MKKLLTMFVCMLLATVAFGQWDMVKGPLTFNAPTDAVALTATSILTVDGDVVQKTIDFGANWTEILLPDGVTMRQVDAANETVAYTCGDDGLIYKTVDAGETWTQVGDTSQFTIDLKEIDVLDTNNVFISGKAGWFMKTADGGASWDTTLVGTEDLDGGVAFASATNGIVFADGNSGIIWTTHDGGDTWLDHPVVMPLALTGASKRMYAASAAVGTSTFIVGAYFNIVWLSTDGGDNWALSGDYTYAYQRIVQIQAFDANNFMAFTSETNILTTSDGGTNWDTLSVGSAQSCQSQAFTSPTNGLVWSSYGQEYSTVDGSTFVPLHDWPGISLYGIAFPAEDKIAISATSGGEFTMSTDNGVTFPYPTNDATKVISSIYKVDFIDEDTGIMGGSAGLILKTTDGGDTWAKIPNLMDTLSNKHINMLHVAPNGDIFAGGSKGLIQKSTDDGDTWVEIESASTQTIYDMCVFSNGMAMLGQGSGNFSISTSTALDTFELVAKYGTISFREIKERNGVILVAASDDIYKTTIDALDTLYSVFDVPGGRDMYCIEFINDTLVYAAGQYGLVYRSTDAGETWEDVPTGAANTIQGLRYNGDKLWAIGQEGVIMSLDILETQADYSETFADGVAELTWVENTAGANTGGLNLAVVADSAGLTNVGVYTDDGYTGLLYAETDKRLASYEVSADIYIVKETSASEALYKGLMIKGDPVDMEYYRFIYRNSSTSNGSLKLQGYNGSWYISKSFYPGVDFDTLETGFHNFKAQVIDNRFWVYIDGNLLPGCPYFHPEPAVVSAGYPGIYVYNASNGKVAFDNFKVNVFEYPKYMVTAQVNMSIQIRKGNFVHAGHGLDIMGSFNDWSTGIPMTDADGDSVYTAEIGEHEAGTTVNFKCRRNGAWDDTEEFPFGQPSREYVVLDEADQLIPVFYYTDDMLVGINGVPNVYALAQNYPNPFNPATTLKFQIPNADMVKISIYNVTGRKVADLMSEQLEAGYYTVNFDASVLPSGVYLYRLTAGEFSSVKKMTLLK
ncbi:MAG: T9SS type A sorting domain-containing protein [Candidatus Marinimicrobia bacterium]|nr:T9SS type A sorting domain-containing protein [Candidatus Neomarinimicrobiota bacterium]